MDRDLIARAMQNIINMNKVQMFEQFKGDHLKEHLREEMIEAAKDAKDQESLKKDIDQLLSKNKNTIRTIEQNYDISQEQFNQLMEDLRSWRRKYIIKA